MSTTFEVYPQSPTIPSFTELLTVARQRLIEQLHDRDVHATPTLNVALHSNQTHDTLPLNLKSPLMWGKENHAWFYVPDVAGGTDTYFQILDDLDYECWAERLEDHAPAQAQRTLVNACLKNGYYWYFRRSIGQSAIINFAYGILAASLAELTDGIIFSEDSAWNYARFPATPEEFYRWYFTPSMAFDPDYADWARRCLEAIPDELHY